MLPSKGRCLGIFLLSRSAVLKPRNNVDEWIDAAKQNSSIMAMSINLEKISQELINLNLVSIVNGINLSDNLKPYIDIADRPTLLGIAKELLLIAPPLWLKLALNGNSINREYIPSSDLVELAWLSIDLDSLLIEVGKTLYSSERGLILKRIGDAAEMFIFSALVEAKRNPLHVSRISDAYGYDIECDLPIKERFEIKAASENTAGRFHISRNEFDKSRLYGNQWSLLQVVFSNKAFISQSIDSTYIHGIYRLSAETLNDLALKDSLNFKWLESAEIFTERNHWVPFDIQLDQGFELPGFRAN